MARKVAEVEVEKPSFTDELAAEAAPVKRPPGAPQMKPFTVLQNREKTRLMRFVAPILSSDLLEAARGDAITPGIVAGSLDMIDAALDACEFLAMDAEAMDAWLEGDGGLGGALALFLWYMDRFDVGEAFASLLS